MKTEKRPEKPPVKNYFLYYFVKATGIFPAPFIMPKVIFKDKSMKRIPKGKLIIMSNHTSFTFVTGTTKHRRAHTLNHIVVSLT